MIVNNQHKMIFLSLREEEYNYEEKPKKSFDGFKF